MPRLSYRSSALALFLGSVFSLHSQTFQGGVRGIVTDNGGAAMPNAMVTLINEATSERRQTLTDGAGEYTFTAVLPATYTVRAEAPSFKRFEQTGVVVATQEFPTVDIKLQLGDVTQTVNVTADAALIETANASTGQVVDKQKLDELPNMGRNPFYQTVKISQNVTPAAIRSSIAWRIKPALRRSPSMAAPSPAITTSSMASPLPTPPIRR